MRKRTLAREWALKIIYQLDITREKVDVVLDNFWQIYHTLDEIKEFACKLVRGVAEKQSNLDEIITRYTENWSIERMAVIDRNILRMATYEMLFMDDIPPKVSINEAIELAKKYSDVDSARFVNGILDRIKKVELDGKE